MQRVVLDTNVIVSGTLSQHGPPARILDAWREGRFSLVTSKAILDEIKRVLNDQHLRKAYPHLTNAHIGKLINLLNAQGILVPGIIVLDVVEGDADDNKFIEAAVEGNAQLIVSGDTHLTTVRKYRGIRIVTPTAFAKRF